MQGLQSRGFRALFASEFLDAFNGNAFKFTVFLLILYSPWARPFGGYALLAAGAAFLLPFVIFSSPAGVLADRFGRRRMIIYSKVFEVALALFAFTAFRLESIGLLILILFLMGAKSAFFSPAKYGMLPAILPEDDLSLANGRLMLAGYVAIILGQAIGVVLPDLAMAEWIRNVPVVFLATACTGLAASFFLEHEAVRPAAASTAEKVPGVTAQWYDVARGFALMRRDWALVRTVQALMLFGFLAGLFELNIVLFIREQVGTQPQVVAALFALLALGMGFGGAFSGRVSDQKVELGLLPLGAVGIAVSAFALALARHDVVGLGLTLFALGVSCGFYSVPLNAFLQYRAPAEARSRVIATSNVLVFSSMLAGFALFLALHGWYGVASRPIMLVCAVAVTAMTIITARVLPYPFLRLCVWTLTHTIYRLRVINKEVIPHVGGALIVANHLSFVDVLFIIVSTSRRVRFVTHRDIYNVWWLRPLCQLAGAIPVSPKDPPKEILRSLEFAREVVRQGDVVCVFPEGQLSRTGNTLRFGRGIEHIMKGIEAPIIPAYLDRVWGSVWSFEGGRFFFKFPKEVPHPITIIFGDPLPPRTHSFDIRQKVLEIGAGAFRYRLEDKMTLPEIFFHGVRHDLFGACIADSSGRRLNRMQTLIAAYALSRKLCALTRGQKYVGILLPPSVGGALANLSLGFLGKTVVNLNYTASREAMLSAVSQCGMKVCLTSRVVVEKMQSSPPCEAIFIEDLVKSIGMADRLQGLGLCVIPPFVAHRIIFGSWKNRDNEELVTVVFTSGSTGQPKGVMLSHANILSNLEGLYQAFQFNRSDVLLGILPFFHSFGFTATLWLPLASSISAVYHFNPLDAKVVGDLCRKNRATVMMATPTFLSAYTKRCDAGDFRTIRFTIIGAEKMKNSIAEAFAEKFGFAPMEGYGCTELSPVVCVNFPDYQSAGTVQKAHKRGTIGLPLPGEAVRVVDPETMRPLDPGQEGLLLVKGANVMKGYLNDPDKTSQVMVDGWYKTGDIAFLDEDGFVTITDRLSRFSKIAGEMVPHMRVETAIHEALKASEQVCVVAAVPDEKKGEKLVVLYVQEFDIAAVREKIKAAGLPNLWIPAAEMFFRIDAVPLLGSGKLDLGAVKKIAAERAGGNKA